MIADSGASGPATRLHCLISLVLGWVGRLERALTSYIPHHHRTGSNQVTMMMRRGVLQSGKGLVVQCGLGARRGLQYCSSCGSSRALLMPSLPSSFHASSRQHRHTMPMAAWFQRYYGGKARALSSSASDTSTTAQGKEKRMDKVASESKEEEPATTPELPTPLFSSPAPVCEWMRKRILRCI